MYYLYPLVLARQYRTNGVVREVIVGMTAGKNILVTCGATVPFPTLVKVLLQRQTLDHLKSMAFVKVIVQFGKGFSNEFERILNGINDKEGGIISVELETLGTERVLHGWYKGVEIIGLEFTPNIEALIKLYADVVISHAGTGSILDSLRLKKPLIAVVNDTLMDNHQEQIARKFESKGYLWAAYATEQEIIAALDKSECETLTELPDGYNRGFEQLLLNVAFE